MAIRPRSLAVRLALGHGALLLLLLTGLWGALYGRLHRMAHQGDDTELADLSTDVVQRSGRRSAIRPESGTFLQIVTPDGTPLYLSPGLADLPPLPVHLPRQAVLTRVTDTWQDQPIQVQYTPVLDDGGGVERWIQVARLESPLHRQLHHSRQLILLGLSLTAILTVLGGFLLASRALRPVAEVTQAARQATARDLSVRLPVAPGEADELSELTATFNAMLDRLEAAFGRERRFTADAAHELMTPLTILRGAVDLALRRDRTAESYRQTLTDLQGDLDRMTTVVNSLLALARAEADGPPLSTEPLDLSSLVQEQWTALADHAASQQVALTATIEPAMTCIGDGRRIGELVTNLIENAIKYTPPAGRVDVRLARVGTDAVLEVSDTGFGFDPTAAERLFERFYRDERPEVRARPGSGLGLAIARNVAQAHGGTLTARSAGPDQGSTFTLTLPLG